MKISEFKNCGAKVVSQPKPTKLFNGRRAAFLLTKLGLVELLKKMMLMKYKFHIFICPPLDIEKSF
ncbi:MAG: hypothetical protein HFI99_13300 [Lachnospiraceae bacterium]|jgi:hypothetical protein|nr:hypothetical protein [Lachnospiraceae bacterium]